MSDRRVSVIVVSYNARNVLERCLAALDTERHEVIVVDNDSDDGSPELVRERFGEVTLVEAGANIGFGAANNLGFEHATGDWYALVNSDAWAEGEGLEALVDFADAHPPYGIFGPQLISEDGSTQKSVRGYPTVWRLCTEYFFLRKIAPLHPRAQRLLRRWLRLLDAVREADWLMGAALVCSDVN